MKNKLIALFIALVLFATMLVLFAKVIEASGASAPRLTTPVCNRINIYWDSPIVQPRTSNNSGTVSIQPLGEGSDFIPLEYIGKVGNRFWYRAPYKFMPGFYNINGYIIGEAGGLFWVDNSGTYYPDCYWVFIPQVGK